MTNTEPSGITMQRIDRIPNPWGEKFEKNDLPSSAIIQQDVKQNEIIRAKKDPNFIELDDRQIDIQIPNLVNSCLDEMLYIETVGREPSTQRLAKLKTVAPSITRVIDRSAPGDYYHLNKNDKYKNESSMQGGDRVRSDQAAILAIVLSGIAGGWPDGELLLFLDQHILLNNNKKLNALQEKAKQAVRNSGIRIAYCGLAEEISPIKRVLNQRHIFIPKESVDFVGPEGITDTFTQTIELKDYLAANLRPGDSFIEGINLQGIRGNRMAEIVHMKPEDTNYFIYAMPTTKEGSEKYRENEIKGTVFYALTGKAAFEPVTHQIV